MKKTVLLLAAVLLVIVVLLQSGKGEGMASNFVAGNQTLGVRQTADLLEKVTWGLVAFILVLSIVSTFTIPKSTGGNSTDSLTEEILSQGNDAEALPEASVDLPEAAPEAAPEAE